MVDIDIELENPADSIDSCEWRWRWRRNYNRFAAVSNHQRHAIPYYSNQKLRASIKNPVSHGHVTLNQHAMISYTRLKFCVWYENVTDAQCQPLWSLLFVQRNSNDGVIFPLLGSIKLSTEHFQQLSRGCGYVITYLFRLTELTYNETCQLKMSLSFHYFFIIYCCWSLSSLKCQPYLNFYERYLMGLPFSTKLSQIILNI